MADDSGEMVASAACLGISHPPGYPLFNLLGRLAFLLPLGTPAFRVNLAALFFALFAAVTLGWILLKRLPQGVIGWKRYVATVLAVMFLVTNRTVLAQSLTAKGLVYTFTLWLCLVVWYTGIGHQGPGWKKAAVLGLSWGVGMAGHWPTVCLWAPALLYCLIPVIRGRGWKAAAFGFSFVLVGLSLYLYLPIRASHQPAVCWGDPTDFGGFLWIVRREFVQGTEWNLNDFSGRFTTMGVIARVFLWESMPLLSLLAAFFACKGLFERKRSAWFAAFMALPVLIALVSVSRAESHYLVNVFLVSLMGLFSLAAGAGAAWVLGRFSARGYWVSLAVLVLIVFWGARTLRLEDKSRYTLVGDLGMNVLQGLPRDAFLLAEGDSTVFPLWYLQTAEGRRRDLAMVPSMFLYHPWGQAQAALKRPSLGRETSENPWVRWDSLYREIGSSLFLSRDRSHLLRSNFPWVIGARPEGLVLRVDPLAETPMVWRKRMFELESRERIRGIPPPQERDRLDYVSKQILRYYADSAFEGSRWLSEKGDVWGVLERLNRGFQFNEGDAAAFDNVAWAVGRLGYPEASADLCREGLLLAPGMGLLKKNLAYATQLAEAEKREGRVSRYRTFARSLRNAGWVRIASRLEKTVRRLEREEIGIR